MIDDILAQKTASKSFLQQQGELHMGIGCACSPEKLNRPERHYYTCIIAIAQSVVTKDMTELIPVYEPFLQEGEVCHDQCEWIYNTEEDYFLPFDTVNCIEGSINNEL